MKKTKIFLSAAIMCFSLFGCSMAANNAISSSSTETEVAMDEAAGQEEVEVKKVDEQEMKRSFDFKTKTVTLNSGYEMLINGIGTYSLLNQEYMDSVTTALENGVRLIDTAYMYHNEAEVGKAVWESDVPKEEIFVVTKLYPNQYVDAANAIEEALNKLDILTCFFCIIPVQTM